MFFLTWALRGQVLGGHHVYYTLYKYMYKRDQVFKVLSICLES